MFSREAFLEAGIELERAEFPLPEDYGEAAKLHLLGWTAAVRSAFEREWVNKEAAKDPGGFRFDVIRRTVVDASDKPLLTKSDREAFMAKPAAFVESLAEACCELQGLRKKDVEELVKNSANDPSSGSSTASASQASEGQPIPTNLPYE